MNSKLVKSIADQIVDVVERAGCPVTLTSIDRQVDGFAETAGAPSWSYEVGDDGDETVLWSGMTDEGCEAFRSVLRKGRVALQPCHLFVYLAQGPVPPEPNWQPVALTPISTANLQGGTCFYSVPTPMADDIMELASTRAGEIWRRLEPAQKNREKPPSRGV